MKRVCIITSAHSPYDDRIYYKEALSLLEVGYKVSIVAPFRKSEISNDGVEIIAVAKPASRLGRFMLAGMEIFKIALSQNADIYHFHDPDLLPWMVFLSMKGKKVIYDVHEYNSESILSKTWLPVVLRKPLARSLDWLEKLGSKRFSGIITVNPHMARIFNSYNENVVSIANYPLKWFIEACKEKENASPLERIIYVGGLNKERGYELIFKAMQLINKYRHDAECLIVGNIDYSDVNGQYPRFKDTGQTIYGVTWKGVVELSNVPNHLLSSRIGWIPWQWTPNNDKGTPVKIFEYMSAGLPVVASRLGFITNIIENVHCGLLVPPDDAKAHADAICYLLNHREEAEKMGENGLRAVQDFYNWENESKKLVGFYNKIIA